MHTTFTNGLKKWRKIVQSSLYFLIDDYERLLFFSSEACNGIKFVDGSTKLHEAFLSTPNKLWVRNTSCFCPNCFGIFFKPETACDGWRMVDL